MPSDLLIGKGSNLPAIERVTGALENVLDGSMGVSHSAEKTIVMFVGGSMVVSPSAGKTIMMFVVEKLVLKDEHVKYLKTIPPTIPTQPFHLLKVEWLGFGRESQASRCGGDGEDDVL